MIAQLQDYLSRSAERFPNNIALVLGNDRLSYSELDAMTNRLARLLRSHGCRPGTRVCVAGAKTPSTIAGMLATLKAGGMYVPVDPASPAARAARIFEAAEPSMVLADLAAIRLLDDLSDRGALAASTQIGILASTTEEKKWNVAFNLADAGSLSPEPLEPIEDSCEMAHMLFTSGSTGVPKGVPIHHKSVIAFVDWAVAYFGLDAADRISGHTPLHFDLSTFDIYGAFAAAAELHLVPSELNVNPVALARFIRDRRLTQWFSVPSTLTYLAKFDVVARDDFPALKRVLWCGEVLPTPVLMHWMQRLPHVRFTNLYGPTEATIASSFYTVPECPSDKGQPIPIGTPCSGEELLILDQGLQPVPHGLSGDLYIAGIGLSPGYWRDESKTAAAFVPDPRDPGSGARIYRTGDLARVGDDQLIYFLGREDTQIKSRGYRIELGEIEAAINAIPDVRECAVVGIQAGGFEGITICCAFSTLNGAQFEPSSLRQELKQFLPTYMFPAKWMPLADLPKNVNGKIDRKVLQDLFLQSTTRITGKVEKSIGGLASA